MLNPECDKYDKYLMYMFYEIIHSTWQRLKGFESYSSYANNNYYYMTSKMHRVIREIEINE